MGLRLGRCAHFALAPCRGICHQDVAETKAAELGVGYDAAYGSHRVGSDDFVTGTRFLD